MGNPYVGNAATFLIHALFGLYILVVMLRFLLQVMHADFYNPVSQFIVKATQPALRPLRRVIPGLGGIDMASVVMMMALQYVAFWLIAGVLGRPTTAAGLLVLSFSALLGLALNVFFWAIVIQIVISWVNPGVHNPVTSVLYSLTEPLMRPARRLLPPFHGFDLSPIPVLIVLQLLQILLVGPIQATANGMMLG